jgi:hypothetical protein
LCGVRTVAECKRAERSDKIQVITAYDLDAGQKRGLPGETRYVRYEEAGKRDSGDAGAAHIRLRGGGSDLVGECGRARFPQGTVATSSSM